jgi:hypothetical protein
MSWLIILVVIVLILAALDWKLGLLGREEVALPYTKNRALFSHAERSFLDVLERAIGEQYRVFGKVRVVDVVSVKPISDRSKWQTAFNRISAKHFDFEKGLQLH